MNEIWMLLLAIWYGIKMAFIFILSVVIVILPIVYMMAPDLNESMRLREDRETMLGLHEKWDPDKWRLRNYWPLSWIARKYPRFSATVLRIFPPVTCHTCKELFVERRSQWKEYFTYKGEWRWYAECKACDEDSLRRLRQTTPSNETLKRWAENSKETR